MLDVPCKLDGLEMTNHVRDLFKDVAKREMNLHSVVTIACHARVWKWTHNFEVMHRRFETVLIVRTSHDKEFLKQYFVTHYHTILDLLDGATEFLLVMSTPVKLLATTSWLELAKGLVH